MLGVRPALSATKNLRIISNIIMRLVLNSGYGSLKKLCFPGGGEDAEDGDDDGEGGGGGEAEGGDGDVVVK